MIYAISSVQFQKIWSTIVLTTYIFITLHQNLINSCSMVIDFDDIKECRTMNFKGGKGPLDSRSFSDDNVKIMYYDTHGNVVKKLPINTKKNRIKNH